MQHLTHDDEPDVWACARTPEAAPTLERLLLDAAPPDDRNDFGETALHVAAARNKWRGEREEKVANQLRPPHYED
ncbi:Regulator of chromosome condensation (RCC1)-like protein [Phytophthora palmivora]|uniref:Regulator of chromosome condensation (RCC1)-like protein n=1 Tax=Phytophthora palmivora TaxID=4796 RepID=A0A2P4X6N7_9STRA|nr:Regulator of chromosome condensation (RCC1)-like protein [Phytophthora palmivora]